MSKEKSANNKISSLLPQNMSIDHISYAGVMTSTQFSTNHLQRIMGLGIRMKSMSNCPWDPKG